MLSLLVTLGTAVGGWLACCLLVTEDLMATRAHYYLASPDDHYLFVTGRALKLARAEVDRPGAVLMGASAMAAATPVPDRMAAMLTARMSFEPFLEKLVAHDLSLLEAVAMAEQLPARFDGAVVIEINPRRLSRGLAKRKGDGSPEYRLGFISDVYQRAADAHQASPFMSGNYFWDNRRFFLARANELTENLWKGPLHFLSEEARARAIHGVEVDGPLGPPRGPGKKHPNVSQKRWDREKRRIQSVVRAGYEQGLRDAQEALAILALRLQQHGDVVLVVLECPIAPRTVEDVYGAEFFTEHVERMARFAAEQPHLEYWNLNDEDGLEDGDYYDMTHLNSANAKTRFGQALARRLAPVLMERAR